MKRQIKSWVAGLSCGSFDTYLAKVVSVVRDREALEKCGLVQDDMFKDASPSRLQEDMVVCKALVDLVRDVFDDELRHVRFYVDRPPYRFAALSGRVPGEPTRTLGWSKKLLAALRKLEAESLKDKWYDQYLDEALWPRSVLVQELLTGMDEAELKVAPMTSRQTSTTWLQAITVQLLPRTASANWTSSRRRIGRESTAGLRGGRGYRCAASSRITTASSHP